MPAQAQTWARRQGTRKGTSGTVAQKIGRIVPALPRAPQTLALCSGKAELLAVGTSVLISLPLRYMHTTVEMIHKKDIVDTIQLMYETLLTLTPKTNLSYL